MAFGNVGGPLSTRPRFGGEQPGEVRPGYRWRHLKYAMVMAGALAGAYQGGEVSRDFHQWSRAQVAQAEKADTPGVIPLLNQAAQADQMMRSTWAGRLGQDGAVLFLRLQLLVLAYTVFKGFPGKILSPGELYHRLHRQGITGNQVTIGVVDSGYRPKITGDKGKVRFYRKPEADKPEHPFDLDGHGSAVVRLIRQACPQSEVVVIPYATPDENRALDKEIETFMKQGFDNPGALNIKAIRLLFQPNIDTLARGVKKAVDEGAGVINVSLNIEQAVRLSVLRQLVLNAFDQTRMDWAGLLYKQGSQKAEAIEEKQRKYDEWNFKLRDLWQADEAKETIDGDVLLLYKPWFDALDYAQAHNVPVILASGNDGALRSRNKKVIGHVNLLSAVPHPALWVVGSTNEDGQIDGFSSEFHDDNPPLLGANGSGELSISGPIPKNPLWMKLLLPGAWLAHKFDYDNPRGTSFAAPDLTALVALIKSICPNLGLEPLKRLLSTQARPATLPQKKDFRPWYRRWFTRKPPALDTLSMIQSHVRSHAQRLEGGKPVRMGINEATVVMRRDSESLVLTDGTASCPEVAFELAPLLAQDKFAWDKVDAQLAVWVERVQKRREASFDTYKYNRKDSESGIRRRVGHGTIAGARQAIVEAAQELQIEG